jgi:transcription-repair coupling factor (superfamily II helicase)
MNLFPLLNQIRRIPGYQSLLRRLEAPQTARITLGLPRSIRPQIATALAIDTMKPLVFVVSRRERFVTLTDELSAWAPGLKILPFPSPNPLFYEKTAWGPRTMRQRVSVLASLTEHHSPSETKAGLGISPQLILTPVRAMMLRTLTPETFVKYSRWVRLGDSIELDAFLKLLIDIGYESSSIVIEPGEFSRRGGIVDLWPPAESNPIRVELFGDEIDSMRTFDPGTQLSKKPIKRFRITPSREGLPREFKENWINLLNGGGEDHEPMLEYFLPWMNSSPAGLLDYLPEDAIVLLDDHMRIEDAITEFEQQAVDYRERDNELGKADFSKDAPLPYLTLSEIYESFDQHNLIDLGHLSGEEVEFHELAEAFIPGPKFGGQLRPLLKYVGDRRMQHDSVVVVSRQAPRLVELYSQEGSQHHVVEQLPTELAPGDIWFVQGALTEGWSLKNPETNTLHLLTDAEIFGWARPQPRRRPIVKATAPEQVYADLKRGDVVVHVDYGIGQFLGLVQRTLDDLQREYLLVEYAERDQVYVPIHQADRITKYVGADGAKPKFSRLGTQEWNRAKEKVRRAVEEIAKGLLELYASRSTVVGHAFSPDSTWQRELEASFPYIETDDQLRAIEVVKHFMELPRPMDILVCGDAGYGKTEVALRAAFKAVMDGKQVAMLVPTTVLAQQHFNTFKERLSAFPVDVEMLSRFRNRSETQKILKRLENNEIDIVIGTHRLLQSDVKFKDLGLLIIDEEQRFGVTHKEFLKQKRTEVDVLTMTATPIPRTLYMALTGARDISTINTPPEERLPAVTHVGPYDPRLIRQAILRELDRGGQTFFVHNRVMTIEGMKRRLEHLVPEARFAVAHGQMAEQKLASVMEQFTRGDVDVLVSTSIIESGLDIPNANTLIVDRADRFGLAQLYQLRGRVGRSASRAYAYFFRHARRRITEDAYQRLEIFGEHTQLGAGYSLAMRDLELRGAGDILGTRQHGHISAIGFHLYTRMLATAVRKKKSEMPDQLTIPDSLPQSTMPLPVSVELPINSAIPADYVEDRELRLQLYRRLAEIRTFDGIQRIENELRDRFGDPPKQIRNLLYQLYIRILAAQTNAISVSIENKQILIQIPANVLNETMADLGSDVRLSKRGLWLLRQNDENWKDRLIEVLKALRYGPELAA